MLLLLLPSRFSHVQLCATPYVAAYQAPPSLGFSRQEHWSGLPFPSPMHESEKWKWSHSVMSDSSKPHGLQPTRLLRPWDFPGKSTGVGCHCLLQNLLSYSLSGLLFYWFVKHLFSCSSPFCFMVFWSDHLIIDHLQHLFPWPTWIQKAPTSDYLCCLLTLFCFCSWFSYFFIWNCIILHLKNFCFLVFAYLALLLGKYDFKYN